MTDHQSEWTDWFLHDGKGCPLPVGTQFGAYDEDSEGVVKYFEAMALERGGFSWDWQWSQKPVPGIGSIATRIIRYRIKKHRALLDLIQMVADLPAPAVKQPAPGVIA